jgi:hypothetical protein
MDLPRSPAEADAVSELVEALLEGKHPPLAWVQRCSAGGRDPVQCAWDRSDAYLMMLQLLCQRWPCFRDSATRAVSASADACGRWHRLLRGSPIEGDFSPVVTQYGVRLPTRLVSWLSDFAAGRTDRSRRIASAIRAAVPTPPSLEDLSWRSAAAYALGDELVVHGRAGHGGYYVVAPPALAATLADEDPVLGRHVREALSAYQPTVPEHAPIRSGALMKPVLGALGARSNRQLHEHGLHCWIEDTATGFVFVPTHNGGARGDQRGFSPLEDRAVRLSRDASDVELGAALRQAFARCTRS